MNVSKWEEMEGIGGVLVRLSQREWYQAQLWQLTTGGQYAEDTISVSATVCLVTPENDSRFRQMLMSSRSTVCIREVCLVSWVALGINRGLGKQVQGLHEAYRVNVRWLARMVPSMFGGAYVPLQ